MCRKVCDFIDYCIKPIEGDRSLEGIKGFFFICFILLAKKIYNSRIGQKLTYNLRIILLYTRLRHDQI